MHTSKLLRSSDFNYTAIQAGQARPSSLEEAFPDYHPLDRVGVVSPHVEDGVMGTSAALLALTTAFYDTLRAANKPFFNYPQHYVFVDTDQRGIKTHAERLSDREQAMAGWTHLDVWPDFKWVATSDTIASILQHVWQHQINRLFWPAFLTCSENETSALPDYALKMLGTHLKSVHFYDSSRPTLQIHASAAANTIIKRSISLLPGGEEAASAADSGDVISQSFEHVGSRTFLMGLRTCLQLAARNPSHGPV